MKNIGKFKKSSICLLVVNGISKWALENKPNTIIGVGSAILVMLGIYIKLFDIYQLYF